MVRKFGVAMLAAGLCLTASQATAEFNKLELKCESSTAKALGKQVGAQTKCVTKCLATQRKAIAPSYAGCLAFVPSEPCITDPIKGPAAKATASIAKACGADCPECYTAQDPGLCTTGNPLVATTQTLVALQGPLVYCVEDAGNTPTSTEAKCEDGTAKNLVKLVGSINKCYDKCVKGEQAAKIPAGSCAPALGGVGLVPTDVATQTCLNTARAKAAAGIDKVCTGLAKPLCYGTQTGTGWANTVSAIVLGQVPDISCGSPSGAFLD